MTSMNANDIARDGATASILDGVRPITLATALEGWAGEDDERRAVAETIVALAKGCAALAAKIAEGPLAGDLGATLSSGEAGEGQKALDVIANDLVIGALKDAPVAAVASEENDAPVPLKPGAPLVVALDPLDGSSNIDTDLSVGTIFAIFPSAADADPESEAAFLQHGRAQLAGGYVIYGPHAAMMITVGQGAWAFVLDDEGEFRLVSRTVKVKDGTAEFAINMSNYRHWDEPVRLYVDDCLAGRDGPRERDFNMRWLGSMVAEAHRIFQRGGIYLYPGDGRKGYARGRLRLLYEAFPIAFLMEQAGGAASDGTSAILDLTATSVHERVPLIFGSKDKVARVARYHLEPARLGEHAPLFARRGLFI